MTARAKEMPSTQRTTPGVSPCRALVAVSIWGCRSDMRHANATASAKFRAEERQIIISRASTSISPAAGNDRSAARYLRRLEVKAFIINGRFPAMLLSQ
jgi:hypothetical protein